MGDTTITWYGSPGPGRTGTGPGQNAGLPLGQLTGFTISMGADATPKQRAQYLKIAIAGVEHLDSGGTAGWGMDSLVQMTGR